MSDPGIAGPLTDFEDRARRMLAHSATAQALLGVDNSDDAMDRIFNVWNFEGGDDDMPVAPVIFVTADPDRMRCSPEKNIDGPVIVSVHVVPPDAYRDTKEHARRWFINQIGLLLTELIDLDGDPIANSSGNHLRLTLTNDKTDGYYFRAWPDWSNPADPYAITGAEKRRTLTTEFEVHLEH